MYAKSLHIYEFKCFGKAELVLQYPGRTGPGAAARLPNVNLILGDNGGGKSSILRALAIAILAPVLLESGFVAYRMVRRLRTPPEQPPTDQTQLRQALLKVKGVVDSRELQRLPKPKDELELIARIDMRERGGLDRLHLEHVPTSPIDQEIFDHYSPAFFVAGYGATRRVETGDFSPGSAQKTRGPRYQRVAGLFEDHVALRPMQAWARRLSPSRWKEACSILNQTLPHGVRFDGSEADPDDGQYHYDFRGVKTPFSALSDGYKAFIGWTTDLLGHLCEVAPPELPLREVPGLVLVDEIDLHLHPEWQRSVVPILAAAFPKLQFVMTSHSALVASTVGRENVFVTGEENGGATIKQLDERIYGRSAESLLLSSYFGLSSTRPESFHDEAEELFKRAARGDAKAALDYLDELSAPDEEYPITTPGE